MLNVIKTFYFIINIKLQIHFFQGWIIMAHLNNTFNKECICNYDTIMYITVNSKEHNLVRVSAKCKTTCI